MRTGKKLLTGMLLVLFIVFVAGCGKTVKTDAALPEVRNSGTAIQWRYPAEEEWRDLVALTELRGAAGENGKDGADGKNGVDGKNGTNGKDGINGTDGKNGLDGKNGTDGKNGLDGKDGADGKNGLDGKDGADGKNGLDGKDGVDGKNGLDGKDGADGKNGIDGKDGVDGINAKNIEVRRAEFYIQWRYEGEEWQNLVAIADIEGPAGQNGTDGANGKTPEFRVSENILQWRYVDDEIWLNLYDLTALKGADGKNGSDGKDGINGKDGRDGTDGTNGQNGSDGKDGNTPFIGENGNWWIGETDTGVKAAGIDGTDGVDGTDGEKGDKGDKGDPGEKGDKGDNGDKGDKGDKGDAGQNGGCAGYFHASNGGTGASFNQPLQLFEDCNSGGLFVWDRTNRTVTLKAGHTYSISFSGSVCISHDMGGWYSVVLKGKQGILKDTLIERYMNDADNSRVWMPFAFNRIYSAGSDIVLQYEFIQLTPGTQLNGAVYNLTIIALD